MQRLMKLRDRLYLFGTAQLAVFGLLFALAYASFSHSVLPMFHSLLEAKTEQVTKMLAGELDVPLGADDRALLARSLATVISDPDLAYLAVRDAHDQIVFAHGRAARELFTGTPSRAHDGEHSVRAWVPVSLEGLRLGSIEVGFTTARFDEISAWAQRIAVIVTIVWLSALLYSLSFARMFTSPIRAMMVFSRKVAGGELAERLNIEATGELRELRDYLNQMTADLERREVERQAAAQHAEGMQRELLAVSRMAGMAEIATGVLHNVGNVLNSLNVSVAMISDQVRGSRVGALHKSIELVDNFPGGLAAFLSTDKGKVLPTYLSTVSKRLAEENAKMLDELAMVNRHVDHIKNIVAMQQSYARPTGLHEPVAIGSLLDDALRMGEASFAKHGIEVIRDYEPGLSFVTDRHKLLQIMINLISNARHALKDHRAPAEPGVYAMGDAHPLASAHQLIVRVRRSPTGVTIAIADTGIGIPAENLDKIFQHGFTTKRGGHGFGLHASANAARELGGSLSAMSDGPGRGATFTLELPAVITSAHAETRHDLRN
jgi:signal transduction histidine kinase